MYDIWLQKHNLIYLRTTCQARLKIQVLRRQIYYLSWLCCSTHLGNQDSWVLERHLQELDAR